MSDHCRTPRWLYKALDAEFCFNLDPCPLAEKPKMDGLALDWTGKRVFCNPPYSKKLPWIQKAFKSAAVTVFVLPGRADSRCRWFRLLIESRAELRFFARSVWYRDAATGKYIEPMGGTMVAIVRRLDLA